MCVAELTIRYQQDCTLLEVRREVCLLAARPLDAALSPHSQSLLPLKLAVAECLARLSQAASPSLTYTVPTRILLTYLILFIYFKKQFSLIMCICRGRTCVCEHRVLRIPGAGVPGGCEAREVGAGN